MNKMVTGYKENLEVTPRIFSEDEQKNCWIINVWENVAFWV